MGNQTSAYERIGTELKPQVNEKYNLPKSLSHSLKHGATSYYEWKRLCIAILGDRDIKIFCTPDYDTITCKEGNFTWYDSSQNYC